MCLIIIKFFIMSFILRLEIVSKKYNILNVNYSLAQDMDVPCFISIKIWLKILNTILN